MLAYKNIFMIFELILTLFLVVANGYFVGSEFALVRMRSSSAEKLVNEGAFGAKTLNDDILPNLDNYLAVTQIGITIASLALGSIGEHALSKLFLYLLPEQFAHLVPAFAIFSASFLVITYLHVVFGELAPKTMAIQRAEKFSRLTAKPMKLFYYLFLPIIVTCNGSSNAFTKMIGISPASETEEVLEEEEIKTILRDSQKGDQIDEHELRMINSIFKLDDTTAEEIMTSKENIVSFEPSEKLKPMKRKVRKQTHTKYPIIKNNKVKGYVDVRDITSSEDSTIKASDLSRDVPKINYDDFVYEIIVTIKEKNSEILAIHKNEEFIGIVTTEDVVEQIIGDIIEDIRKGAKE